MAPNLFNSIIALENNPIDIFLESIELLIRIASNVLNQPNNSKFRSLSLKSNVITNKLLPANGAMECLMEMGFQKKDDTLYLPQENSLNSIKCIYNELLKIRDKCKRFVNSSKLPVCNKITRFIFKEESISKNLDALKSTIKDPFLKNLIFWCYYVLKYENKELQKKALNLVPLIELNLNVIKKVRNIQLEYKKKNISEELIDYQEMLLIELCNWFNTKFFSWVDTPQCSNCGFMETDPKGMSSEVISGAGRVEEYQCQKCKATVLFPRYNDPEKLLETRKGRCGEWANCFCLFCKAMGWDARLIIDETDHVWTEIYSIVQSKWIHCDPCENAVDTPLIYECGWNKKLSYVIAYSVDEIQDVTWRYSCNHAEVLKNRKKCREIDLINFIVEVRNILLNHTSAARKNFVLKRTVQELVALMKQNEAKKEEEKGRISGSLAWRLLRQEISNDYDDFKPFIWELNEEDKFRKKFELSYITSKDHYIKNSKILPQNWKAGVYKFNSIFRKDEKDWKMSYLAREEGALTGFVSWKFQIDDNFSIKSVEIRLVSKTFETGVVSIKLFNNVSCVIMPSDKEVFSTNAFFGSKSIELMVEMSGGTGPNAWQHAQILRQSFSSPEETFHVTISLV